MRNFIPLFRFKIHHMKYCAFFTSLIISATFSFGQNDWMKFPDKQNDSSRTANTYIDYSSKKGKVTLHQDARIEKLGEFVRQGENTVEGVKMAGYRIVIFFDQDKSKVEGQKALFLSRYNEHKAYVDYVAPNYRVRVGNFRSRLEAEALKAEILGVFPTAVVVSDQIQLPELPMEEAPASVTE